MNREEREKNLLETGSHIGSLFMSELERMLESKDELTEDEKRLYKISLGIVGGNILEDLQKSGVLPIYWPEFASVMANTLQVMLVECIRGIKDDEN